MWHFSEKDQSSHTPSLDLLEIISATPSRVSADLLHPEMSVGSSEKISVDLLNPEILSTLSGTGKFSVYLLHPEFVSAVSETERMSVDLLHPEIVSEKSGNRSLRFMAPESCSDRMETERKMSVNLLNESEKISVDREKNLPAVFVISKGGVTQKSPLLRRTSLKFQESPRVNTQKRYSRRKRKKKNRGTHRWIHMKARNTRVVEFGVVNGVIRQLITCRSKFGNCIGRGWKEKKCGKTGISN